MEKSVRNYMMRATYLHDKINDYWTQVANFLRHKEELFSVATIPMGNLGDDILVCPSAPKENRIISTSGTSE